VIDDKKLMDYVQEEINEHIKNAGLITDINSPGYNQWPGGK
jgi:hypothetical protein